MNNFLNNAGACFYHITRRSRWLNDIQLNGLRGDEANRIFVARTDYQGVLYSIALNQILELEEEPDLVILRLSQEKNTFSLAELSHDYKAIETTSPLQSIIIRQNIPLANIDYVDAINVSIDELGLIANKSDYELPQKPLFQQGLSVVYIDKNGQPYKVNGEIQDQKWTFNIQYI
ncbi:hypothetical protein [Mucilaginibacter sp.]|uniref:hypothetical protein n=1 Tax=Mucilaginibacter sp. TaxID=1882438 RepID=UPI003D1076E6